MKKILLNLAYLTLGSLATTLAPTATGATIDANFSDGNSTTLVDAYTGIAGDGWLSSWSFGTNAPADTSFTNSVINTSQLNSGGNYLSYDMSYTGGSTSQGMVVRHFDSATVSTVEPIRYTFDYRIDTALTNTTQRYSIYNRIDGTATGTDSSLTWAIQAVYDGSSGMTWYLWDGNGAGGVNSIFDTGFSAVEGTTYSMTVDVDPASKSWAVSITDGTNTYTSDSIGFRANTTTDGSYLHFGTLTTANTSLGYSLDNLQISAIPEPALSTALLGAVAMLMIVRKRRRDA
ncbi:hypothetical protein [Coraliomargarita parva]|uniref:hypothetical protein n=1 Tax=Coraliomargarita parva TaxID=3014050 RepID=UPI0022B3B70F|nr:hypothetical protein [Coraliomargarita parva]